MLAAIDDDSATSEVALQRIAGQFDMWERSLSRFRKDSDLAELNQSSGNTVKVSDALWQVLESALEAAKWTEGLATPMVHGALLAAGYDRSFAELNNGGPFLHSCTSIGDWKDVSMNHDEQTVRLPQGAGVDLGGFAKGWAADVAAAALARIAPALVDAGGDIAISGPQANGDSWPIGISAPYGDKRDLDLPLLLLKSGGVATSGRDYRRLHHGGHHIVDPRTGAPAHTDVLTATVVAPTAQQADAAAKTVLILGSNAGLAWIGAHPPLEALVVLEDDAEPVRMSQHFHRFIWS